MSNSDSFIITLIFEDDQLEHQVWGDMLVTQLIQDVARIFGLSPPSSSIVLMLYGLRPVALRIGYRLSDPPTVSDGARILVFVQMNSTLCKVSV